VVLGDFGLTILAGFLSPASRLRGVDLSMYIYVGKYESFVEESGFTFFHLTVRANRGLLRMAFQVLVSIVVSGMCSRACLMDCC
jgi:hypothetical protein